MKRCRIYSRKKRPKLKGCKLRSDDIGVVMVVMVVVVAVVVIVVEAVHF
jgi:hypothetical protein